MSSEQNPYEAPDVAADSEQPTKDPDVRVKKGIHRAGPFLVVVPARGARLPKRCVVCNAPGATRTYRKLYRHHPRYYFLLLLSPVAYLIVALIVRERAGFEMSLCVAHARRRHYGLWIGWGGTLACLVGFLVLHGSNFHDSLLTMTLLLLLIACPFVGMAMAKVVTAHRIDKRSAWLHVGRPFLESFEERANPRKLGKRARTAENVA